MTGTSRPTGGLAGRRIVTTREHPGELDRRLEAEGAEVVHVPLISTVDPDDGGRALAAALDRLDGYDRIVVTSPNGARRVAAAVAGRTVRTAAVGAATAAELERSIGRRVDLVPDRQLAIGLIEEFARRVHTPERVLVAQANLAAPTLADGLRALGHEVDVVTAYATVPRSPAAAEIDRARDADAVVVVSGSAARAWAEARGPGPGGPPVCAIGPSTASAARDAGLVLLAAASDHSVAGVVDALIDALGPVL